MVANYLVCICILSALFRSVYTCNFCSVFSCYFRLMNMNMWMSYECSDRGTDTKNINNSSKKTQVFSIFTHVGRYFMFRLVYNLRLVWSHSDFVCNLV
jgi:hypothetical protein